MTKPLHAMSFEEKAAAGHVSKEGWPEAAWFVLADGKIERVAGWLKIQQLAREDDAYPNTYHGTREAAEEWAEMHYHPARHAHREYKAGRLSLLELQGRVGEVAARELIEHG